MSYITKSGITIDTEEELLARAQNLGMSQEDFINEYIGDGNKNEEVSEGEEEDGFFGGGGMLDAAIIGATGPVGWSAAVAKNVWDNTRKQRENAYKKSEEKRKSDPLWVSTNEDTKAEVSKWLSNDENVLNAIGDTDINWDHLDRRSEGNETLYKKLAKAVKAQIPLDDSALEERDIDYMIRDIVAGKAAIERKIKATKHQEKYDEIILEQDLTDEAVEATQLNTTINSLSPELQDLAAAQKKLRDMQKAGVNSPEDKQAIIEQEKAVQVLLDNQDGFFSTSNQLVSWDGAVIGTPLEGDKEAESGFEISQEEIDEIKAKIANGEIINKRTYADHIENLFNKNSRDLFYHQQTGKEIIKITSNDHAAWRTFLMLGYKSTGKNANGLEFEISVDDLAKHYNTVVNDGSSLMQRISRFDIETTTRQNVEDLGGWHPLDAPFDSAEGYFGATENVEFQDPTFWETINPWKDTEFRKDDNDRNFKLMLRDFRDNKKQILAERGVLTDMHVLNINPATKTDDWVEDTVDFFARGAEVVTEGFGLESQQWLGTDAVDITWSNRKEKDLLQSMHDQYGGIVTTEEMKHEIKRSGAYEVAEGVGAFVPALIEFALIDVAAKKVGVITGIPKLAKRFYKIARLAGVGRKTGRAIANVTNFTGHALYEEAKMKIAFDEMYHMGGGVGFYSVGRLLKGLKFASNSQLLNTIVNTHGKGGLAGMISVPTAAHLEAAISDLRGNEDYMTYVQDTYFDENLEFNLSKHVRGGLIDFFVFSLIGLKGFATKEGRLAYRPTTGKKIGGVTWWKGLEDLEIEAGKIMRQASTKMNVIDNLLKGNKNSWTIDGKTYDRVGLEKRKAEIKKEGEKYSDLFVSVNAKLNEIYKHNDWQDDAKATKMVERQFASLKHLFGKDIKIVASKKVPKWVGDKDAAAEYSKTENAIYVNTTKASPGKLPHEIVHVTMAKIFEKNPSIAIKMQEQLKSVFDKQPIFVMETSKGTGKTYEKQVTLSQFIKMKYGIDRNLGAHEYVAYAAELLADPRNYSKLVDNGTFKNAETSIKDFATKHGIKDFDISTKEQLIKFMYNFTESIKSGTLTSEQVAKFKNMDKQGLFVDEPNSFDARLPETKANMEVEAAFNSKELKQRSADTQSTYERLKSENSDINSVVEQFTTPTPGNRTSVAGKYFDDIVYNTIDIYNRGRIRSNNHDQQVLDPTDRYDLALELVYNLNVKEGSKARGLKEIIKDYENYPEFVEKYKDKDGIEKQKFVMYDKLGDKKLTQERIIELEEKYGVPKGSDAFKQKAISEGYKGKQNVTKTVMQTLQKRIYELKGGSLDKGKTDQSVYQTISYDASPELKTQVENIAGTGYTDVVLPHEKKSEKKKVRLDGKEYNYPVRVSEVYELNTDRYSTRVPDIIENLPAEKLTYDNIAKTMMKDLSLDLQKSIGLDPAMKPKVYVETAKEWFDKNEELAFEGLEKTSNPDMYEATNINKSIFKKLFTKTNEKFKSSEMPDFLDTNARTLKWEKGAYKKGELNNIIFSGRDAGVIKKKIIEYFERKAKIGASQITRDKISDPRIQDLIKSKNLNKFINLKADNIIPYIKTAIRGATPDKYQSQEIKTWDKFMGKWKKTNFGKFKNLASAYQDTKYKMTEAEQRILEKHEDVLLGSEGYNVGKDAIKELQNRAAQLRNLEQLKVAIINPKIWGKKYKGINQDLIEILSKEKISIEDLNRLNINKTFTSRLKDKNFQDKYQGEFVPELMNTLDNRTRAIMINSFGAGKYKFLGSDKVMSATERDLMFKDVQDFNEKLDFNPEHVKIVDNSVFKKKYMEELDKVGDLKNSPARRARFFKMIAEKYLTPKLTAKDKKAGKKQVTIEETIKANEGLQKYLYGKLFDFYNKSTDKINAINQIQFLLQAQTSIGNGFSRALATHTAFTLEKGGMYSEHELQVMNFNGNFLVNMLKNAGSKVEFNKNFDALAKQYKQSIIPKELQKFIDSKEQGGNVGNVYKDGYNSDLSAKANYLYATKLGLIVDIKTGKTYKELIEIENNASQTLNEIKKIKENLVKKLPKGTFNSKTLTSGEIMQKLSEIDAAFGLARKRNKTRKGLSVFDFDQTLANTKEKVIVTIPNDVQYTRNGKLVKRFKIGAAEFAREAEALEAKGAKFDFSEFEKVVGGTKGPLADLALKRQGKFGSKDIFVLTARPQTSAVAIHKFLKGIGLEIPLKNITGLEDGKPEAKALYILEKAAKGYNDFYFADDAYKNVKAVQDVLGVIDVKSKVQQAFNSQDLNTDINSMIERKTGIGKDKVYSRFKGNLVGKKSGKTQFIASSAQDFEGLMYRLYGKGKQGDKDMAFIKKNLIRPFNRASNAVSADRIATMNEFKEMKKILAKAGIPKNLRKEIAPGEPFSIEQSVRVYTWTKQGMEIPGLSKADLKTMVDYVEKNPSLMKFSQELIDLGKGDGYMKPGSFWETGTITTDLLNNLNKNRRAKYLEESGWTEAADIIFSKENLNKMEAGLGTKWRDAMENILLRMKTGRNRPLPGKESKLENMALDWVNNSVGAIMFLNTRSAVLQTISAINYINWSDNNPFKAGQAMAKNPKQWAKTFNEIFNSEFMIERRGGLKINVNENEIADAADRGGARGIIATILKKGFVLTQFADSFAIASGGASFYINRARTYEKQGMSKNKAKKKAFEDFRELTEEAQQSSRADRISQQQASALGRVVLAFANTPSQYARLMQKAASDIKNGRGDFKTNLSKLMYYSFIQNVIFNSLQMALFRDAFDEEEGIQTDTGMIANGMLDSILRGMGYQGAAISTIKNMIVDAHKQSKKKNPKYSDTALKVLDISPPVDSKISKLRAAGRVLEYDMDEVTSKGWSLDNPAYLAAAQTLSALTNIPLDRLFKKYDNLEAALDADTENWQKVALTLGWSEWQLGMNQDGKSAEEFVREIFSRETFKREIYKK